MEMKTKTILPDPEKGWPKEFDLGTTHNKVEFKPSKGQLICVQRAPSAWEWFQNECHEGNVVGFEYTGNTKKRSFRLFAEQFPKASPTQTKLTISGGTRPGRGAP